MRLRGTTIGKPLTAKLAKETVRPSYPKSVCRFGWKVINGVREDFYEIYPTLKVSGDFIGRSYRSPTILGKGSTKAAAWIAAAQKVMGQVT